eukprot:gene27898-33692_t
MKHGFGSSPWTEEDLVNGHIFLPGSHKLRVACYPAEYLNYQDVEAQDRIIYVDKEDNSVCYLLSLTKIQAYSLPSYVDHSILPVPLKLDPNILAYVRSGKLPYSKSHYLQLQVHRKSVKEEAFQVWTHIREDIESCIMTARSSLPRNITFSEIAKSIHHELLMLHSPFLSSLPSDILDAALVSFVAHKCSIPPQGRIIDEYTMEVAKVEVRREGIKIAGYSTACLLPLAFLYASHPLTLSLHFAPRPTLLNYDARGLVQSGWGWQFGRGEGEVYTEAGLQGQGQVVGVADSGLDDSLCFLVDYSGTATVRNGSIEMGLGGRRKVVRYVAYADDKDDEGGHGTHVVTTIVGKSISDLETFHGIAPESQVSFYDIGETRTSTLKIPPISGLLTAHYQANARVMSNSWGGGGGFYSPLSRSVDAYTYTHPDVLVVFAAGNMGEYGTRTILSPGNAKNTLTVGSIRSRDAIEDTSAYYPSFRGLSSFSSVGPTYDRRLKPDLVAPGEGVVSGYATKVDRQQANINVKGKVCQQQMSDGNDAPCDGGCAVHSMSGTSMSTPFVAGLALLVRQFFTSADFWPTVCPPLSSSCQTGVFSPSGALLKAMLLHATVRVGWRYSDGGEESKVPLPLPPDSMQGYGGVRLNEVLPLKNKDGRRDEKGLSPNQSLYVWNQLSVQRQSTIQLTLTLPQHSLVYQQDTQEWIHSHPLKVTVAWTDPPHLGMFMDKLLIQDLDLFLLEGDGIKQLSHAEDCGVYIGNQPYPFPPTPTPLSQVTLRHTDDRNPNEQIHLTQVRCKTVDCNFRIVIQSYALPHSSPLLFALVVTTNGTLSEPVETLERVSVGEEFNDPTILPSAQPIPAFLPPLPPSPLAMKTLTEWKPPPPPPPPPFLLHPTALKRRRTLYFKELKLGVRMRSDHLGVGFMFPSATMLEHDRVLLGTFAQTGLLSALELKVQRQESNTTISGGAAWLLALLVTSPNNLTLQIGGLNWAGADDRFVIRRWPTPWTSRGYLWTGDFRSRRDVGASGLRHSLENTGGMWKVELAMGSPFVRNPENFSGKVELVFQQSLGDQVLQRNIRKSAVYSNIIDKDMTRGEGNVISDDVGNGEAMVKARYEIMWKLMCVLSPLCILLLVIYVFFARMQTKRRERWRGSFSGLSAVDITSRRFAHEDNERTRLLNKYGTV